jgi:Bacterial TniB protein
MTNDAGHLNSATAELFALSSTERIRAIETDRWVQYPRARQALAILSYVLRHPRSTRMPSVAIYGDVQLARRFDAFLLPRWSTNEEFENFVRAVLRNLPLRLPSVLTVESLRQILDVSDGLTAKIFSMLNELAVQAIVAGHERITDEAVSQWSPVIGPEVTYS